MTAEGTFREDLFYRLAEIVVRIPSLAGRAGDAGLLARHFATKYAAAMNPNVKGLAPDALAAVARPSRQSAASPFAGSGDRAFG